MMSNIVKEGFWVSLRFLALTAAATFAAWICWGILLGHWNMDSAAVFCAVLLILVAFKTFKYIVKKIGEASLKHLVQTQAPIWQVSEELCRKALIDWNLVRVEDWYKFNGHEFARWLKTTTGLTPQEYQDLLDKQTAMVLSAERRVKTLFGIN